MATIFPANPTLHQEFSGYRWNGTAWKVIGVNLSFNYVSFNDLYTHENLYINAHHIPNTENIPNINPMLLIGL